MGLDTTHDAWHGSYGGFKMFRDILAEAANYTLDYDAGYTANNYQGLWSVDPDNILDIFFVHSDCDGWIMPLYQKQLADALEALIPRVKELGHDFWVERVRMFVEGLRAAHEEYEVLGFH